ncbi:MAG: hypothetical protein V7K88_01670 [Nostoc sp.]|uniref:hypothetical protein n=1 Tax=Nostoc sp. TaxID=1180 RepID=UPI002FFA3D43
MKRLAPELVSDEKLNISNFLENQNKSSIKATIWTEGKTDIKHLNSALKWLEDGGKKFDFEIDFKDDLDPQKQGSSQLLEMCKQLCKTKHQQPMIAIFDRDEPNVTKQVDDDTLGFKDWTNRMYSFALPIPQHRRDYKEICIEHYYQDNEIQRQDINGRRLFLSNEFHSESGRHLNDDFTCADKNKFKSKELKIIDQDVFDKNNEKVAISKNDFADNIFNKKEKFDNFEFGAFEEVFRIIEKIVKYYAEELRE